MVGCRKDTRMTKNSERKTGRLLAATHMKTRDSKPTRLMTMTPASSVSCVTRWCDKPNNPSSVTRGNFASNDLLERRLAPKLYRMTRHTRQFVWLRWNGYEMQMRGLSMRMTWRDFNDKYLPYPRNNAFDERFYFRRSNKKGHND